MSLLMAIILALMAFTVIEPIYSGTSHTGRQYEDKKLSYLPSILAGMRVGRCEDDQYDSFGW